jgi:hypothetical protein
LLANVAKIDKISKKYKWKIHRERSLNSSEIQEKEVREQILGPIILVSITY